MTNVIIVNFDPSTWLLNLILDTQTNIDTRNSIMSVIFYFDAILINYS